MATKAELEQALADRDAPPPTVSTAVALPVIVTGCLLMVAVLYLAAQKMAGPGGTFSPTYLGVVAIVGWLVAHFAIGHYFPSELHGALTTVARTLTFATGIAATIWLTWTGRVGPAVTWPYLLIGGGVLLLWWSAIVWIAGHRDGSLPVVVTGNVDAQMPWRDLVDRSTGGRAVVTEVNYHRAGARLTVEPGRTTDDDGDEFDEDLTFDDFATTSARFATLASREYRRRTGDRLPLNCARPEEGRDDAEFVLHVTMRDVFGSSAEYVPAAGAQDIATPKDLGEFEDATRIMISLLSGHARIVGCTGSGKSVEANNWIARITECNNALVWVCATDKLIPLIFPWLRSWFAGRTPQPCLDYVAGLHIDRVLGMLADAYRLCCERNARLTDESKMTATPREPAVFVFVEEMSHSMEWTDTIVTHDGIECDLSTLIMMVARAGRSANVRLVLMSQTALNSSGGDAYPEIIRNCQIRVCLRTMESHDGYRTIPALNNVDTTVIPLHTKIVQPSTEVARAMPGKAANLDGTATIDRVAVRNASYRPVGGVEPESHLGKRYRDRWNPARHPELARAVAKHGLRWRVPDAVEGAAAPTNGGIDMNVSGDWDEAVKTELLPRDDGGPDGPAGRRSRAFRIPDGSAELARMREIAEDLRRNPPRTAPDDEPGEEPIPLPEPLKSVIAWLDEQEDCADFYLTETIAAAIGDGDHLRLGRKLYRLTGIRSRQALVEEDARKRRGYDTAALREAATRLRFGL